METQIRHDLKAQSTTMRARLKWTSADDIVMRTYSVLDTKSYKLAFDGYARKFFSLEGTKTHTKDERLRIGPGFRFSVGSQKDQLYVGPVVKKELHFNNIGPKYSSAVLKVMATSEWDLAKPKVSEWKAFGKASVSCKLMKLTDRQDVRIMLGANAEYSPKLKTNACKVTPFAQLRENNWACTVYKHQQGQSMMLSYDL